MDIDFVILWVDGNDIEWQKEMEQFTPKKGSDVGKNRYRDWDNLHYWFRGIEKFSPWVRKIHFVTWGHLPKWLNTNNPKLNIIKHSDYIPKEYLPTFSSHPIELNLHRIKDLSDNFVLFNDDTFIIKPTDKSIFFKDGLPCDIAALDTIVPTELFSYVLVNNIKIINNHFDKKRVIKAKKSKWFNLKYGKELYRTLSLYPWSNFSGIYNPHLPIAYNKQTFTEVWDKEYEILNKVCYNKFRNSEDISGWVFRYWRIAKGDFNPISKSIGKYYSITDDTNNENIYDDIIKQKYNLICTNDELKEADFELIKKNIIDCFNKILPEKSSYEL